MSLQNQLLYLHHGPQRDLLEIRPFRQLWLAYKIGRQGTISPCIYAARIKRQRVLAGKLRLSTCLGKEAPFHL